MILISRIIFAAALCLSLVACQTKPISEADALLDPSKKQMYTNLTDRTSVDLAAQWELTRSMRLADIEFCMVILKSTPESLSLETYAAELFEQWRIGEQNSGRGVLYVIVDSTRELKIEVSYELEPYFPDIYCHSFQDTIKNYYAGDFFGDVVSNLISTMAKKYRSGNTSAKSIEEYDRGLISRSFLSGGAGIKNRFTETLEDIHSEIAKYQSYNNAMFLPGRQPEESIEAFFSALEAGALNCKSPLLTRGSQLMLLEYPKSKDSQQREAECYRLAGEYYSQSQGDFAAARFHNNGYKPVFLRRNSEGLWLVDRLNGWLHNFFISETQQNKLENQDHAWMFAFPEFEFESNRNSTPKLYDVDHDPLETIASLTEQIEKQPENAALYFKLSRVFFHECYWLRAAMDACEKGLKLEPDRLEERYLYINIGNRFPRFDQHEYHYEQMIKHHPQERQAWIDFRRFSRRILRDPEKVRDIEQRGKHFFD